MGGGANDGSIGDIGDGHEVCIRHLSIVTRGPSHLSLVLKILLLFIVAVLILIVVAFLEVLIAVLGVLTLIVIILTLDVILEVCLGGIITFAP